MIKELFATLQPKDIGNGTRLDKFRTFVKENPLCLVSEPNEKRRNAIQSLVLNILDFVKEVDLS